MVKRASFFLALLLAWSSAFAESVIVSREIAELPKYESIRGISRYATAEEYATAVADARYTIEKVGYRSGGLTVFTYVFAPKKRETRLPVIIFNRGSFTRDEFAGELLPMFRRLGDAGFVVLAPMLRQSGGAEGRDEVGGADLDDLKNIVGVVRELDFADADRLFMYGESRGGAMTFMAARDGFPMRAAATFGAFTDFGDLLAKTPPLAAVARNIWPDYDAKKQAIDTARSAVAWPEKINTPLLLIHGGADEGLSPEQTLRLALLLQQHGKKYELIIRAGSKHVMSDWRSERDARVVEWFRRHM